MGLYFFKVKKTATDWTIRLLRERLVKWDWKSEFIAVMMLNRRKLSLPILEFPVQITHLEIHIKWWALAILGLQEHIDVFRMDGHGAMETVVTEKTEIQE